MSSIRSDYLTNLAGSLNEQRKQQELCDIIITIGERSFPAHRAILAASSRYFKAMFTSGFKESSADEVKIDGDPEVFETLLEFIYSGNLDLTSDESRQVELLQMVCYFQLTDVNTLCRLYARWIGNNKQHLRMDDIFKIADLSVGQGLQKLVEVAVDALCKRLKEIKACEEFLKSDSLSLLEMLLGQPHFTEAKEEEVRGGFR